MTRLTLSADYTTRSRGLQLVCLARAPISIPWDKNGQTAVAPVQFYLEGAHTKLTFAFPSAFAFIAGVMIREKPVLEGLDPISVDSLCKGLSVFVDVFVSACLC